ncbi:MAG TPA: TonB family protein [Bryobacteraceae bacterium]|nr:TonB family protein [Bryobacteraceae bacterium]
MSPPVALIECGQPEYTEEARIAHLAGRVLVSLTVDDEGVPNQIHVVSALGLGLDENAMACVRQSHYSPAQRDGKPVPLKMRISLPFEKQWDSNWHLAGAAFETAADCNRPVVVKAGYPSATSDRRAATVSVHLTISKDGTPRDMLVHAPQDPKLDKEAVAILAAWRFRPGMRNREPVDVPATLTLVRGAGARSMASSHHPR